MKRQDVHSVRTAAELERKYNFGEMRKTAAAAKAAADKANSTLETIFGGKVVKLKENGDGTYTLIDA